jgi:DNA-binding LytR/AlgR family response regulator
MDVLESIKIIFNSRLEALLTNGEKLMVSRKYLPDIKARFQKEGGKYNEK